MKIKPNIVAFALLLLCTPRACFALWDVIDVSKSEAIERGLKVRLQASGQDRVSVQLEFNIDGKFKVFSPEHKLRNASGVDLWIGQGEKTQVTAPLREDHSKAGRVMVGFTVDRAQLDQSQLHVMVPYSDGALGGVQLRLRVKDYVEPKKGP